ncbi:MAG: ParB/RepB/Spo0J family partition protein [Raoultibacter sp.]
MAKNTKSGLGRGLNSLLGGSADEAIPAEAPVKERETVEFEESSVQSRNTKPTAAKKPISQKKEELTSKEEASEAPKEASDDKEAPVSDSKEKAASYMDDDHIIIKGVKEREVAKEEAAKPVEAAKTEQQAKAEEKEAEPAADSSVDEVPISSVHPNPDQPRTNFKKEEIEELAASIDREGLLQPILVRKIGAEYQIIAGERRWQACKTLNIKSIPIRIREADDDKALELALIENIQRSDLNPIEEAYGYLRLMERKGMTQSQVAEAVSKGRSTVANALRLLELPEDAQQLLFEEKISSGHARAILSIPSKEGRQKLSERLVKEKLSVREAESFARLYSMAENKTDGAKRKVMPRSYKTVARSLKETLSTNVRVKSAQGKNKIEIEFQDEEDLKRLFDIISA